MKLADRFRPEFRTIIDEVEPWLESQGHRQWENFVIYVSDTTPEFNAGHIPGAVSIPIDQLPARLSELQAGLASAGYAVTGGTDAGALVQLASAESRPVDAAMIDGGWLTPGTPAQWVESLFSARNVPCVTIHGADGRRARATVDKLLSVV